MGHGRLSDLPAPKRAKFNGFGVMAGLSCGDAKADPPLWFEL